MGPEGCELNHEGEMAPKKPTNRQLKEQVQARALPLVKVLGRPAHEIEEVFW